MLFSIVVPIYNVEAYIERCVRSLTDQTYGDIEIILVDDGSPDNCPALCDAYAEGDSRIRVVHKENGGLSDARNAGLKAATGDYVIFVDSDDYIAEDTCERLIPFTKQDCDVLVCDASVEGGVCDLDHIDATENIISGTEYLKKAVFAGKAPMAAWLNVYKRSFLTENDLFFKYGILHEDEQFTPRVLIKAKRVILTGISFYRYIIRDGSITTKKDRRKNATDFYQTCCELEKIYLELNDEHLKRMFLDLLVSKYLSLFESGNLMAYGKEYLPIAFLSRNAYLKKTKFKVTLIRISPGLYRVVRRMLKG